MSDKLEQAAGGEGFNTRKAIPDEDDVEGHSILRRDDGAVLRRDAEDDGFHRRQAIPDDGDDVEGHQMLRRDDGAVLRRDAEDEYAKRVGPGEGFASRS